MSRRPAVSVIGSARLHDPQRVEEARALGAALIEARFRLVTGGLGGVMEAVSYGARHASSWTEGSIVGIVPTYRAIDANPWCDIVIPTGMQLARNVLVVASGDVVLAYGGGSGTMSELAVAWQLGKPIVAFGSDGWAGRVAGTTLDTRSDAPVRGCATIADAVAACLELCGTTSLPGDIGDGWRRRGA